MKKNIGTKLSIGLLGAVIAIGVTRAVVRAKAAEAEEQKAQAAAAEAEARAQQSEVERQEKGGPK